MQRRQTPAPGQESVWDYPRPPRVEPVDLRVQVIFNSVTIADTRRAQRVLETSHPPVYYIPPADIRMDFMTESGRRSFCEFKGEAHYYSIKVNGQSAADAAWFYPTPVAAYAVIARYVAFYPSRVEACFVGDEFVQAQAGDFYGGWITSSIVGPFKGGPGTWGW